MSKEPVVLSPKEDTMPDASDGSPVDAPSSCPTDTDASGMSDACHDTHTAKNNEIAYEEAASACENPWATNAQEGSSDAKEEIKKRKKISQKDTNQQRSQDAPQDATEKEHSMTLMEHLGELRTRIVRMAIAVGLAFMLTYSFAEQLFAELCKPLVDALPEGSKLIFTALPEAFFVYLQVGIVAAIFLASPYLFYQIWAFVAPGLYEEEKIYIVPIAVISAIFFITGASFCFLVVFPYAFTFFVGFGSETIVAMPSLKEYLGFALKLLIAFGLIFEMPLFTFFLSRMGLVTAARMRHVRRYAILCIFIAAAILTPPDVISQLLMAIPMMLLYEISIGVAVVFGRKKSQDEPHEDNDIDEDHAQKETA